MKRLSRTRNSVLSALYGLLLLAAAPVMAQSAIEDIQFTSLSGDRFQIELVFDGTPPEPEIFEIENPARLSVDFVGVGSNLDERRYPLEYRNADSVVVLESGGRTRMVLNLINPTSYSTSVSGNRFLLQVGGDAGSSAVVQQSTASAASQAGRNAAAAGTDITNIDFTRGEDGAGQIVVELANRNVVGSVSRVGTRLRLTFDEATMPSDLEARLDVMDFATPVRYVDAYQQNEDVVIEALVEGGYDYIAYQTRGRYTLSVSPTVPEGTTSGESEFPFSGERMTMIYQDIAVRSALDILADFNDFSLVVSDTVSGNITLRLTDVPWDQALDMVLRTRNLDKRIVGNVMYVAPAAEIANAELQQLENQRQTENLAPLVTEYIEVNYARAADIVSLLSGVGSGEEGGGRGILSSRGSIAVDERTNTLIVQDVAPKIQEVRELLARLDVPVRQVLIEARIVTATANFSRALGIRWGGAYSPSGTGDTFLIGSGNNPPTLFNPQLTSPWPGFMDSAGGAGGAGGGAGGAGGGTGAIGLPDALGVDLGVNNATSNFSLGYAGSQGLLELELSALEASGNGEVIAQPHITTQDKQTAVIQSGTQVPYQAQAGGAAGGTTIEFIPALLSLEVTPQITPDGRIIMQLRVTQDSVVTGAGAVPAIATNTADATVLVDDGSTIVLGGVFREEVTTTVSKTPLLGDLPYLGNLFKRTEDQQTKTELLIFITPSILEDLL